MSAATGLWDKFRNELPTIQEVINQHYNRDRRQMDWKGAFTANRNWQKRLMIGPGNRTNKITRLVQFVKERVREGTLKLPTGQTPPSTPPEEPGGNNHPVSEAATRRAGFAANADLLKQIAQQYRNDAGKIEWIRAFEEHPEWAQQVGFKRTPQFLGRLGYWASRNLGDRKQGKQHQDTAADSGINWCPKCGCNLKAVSIALNLVQ